MDKKLLRDYARLLANKGLAIEKGDEVFINTQPNELDFVHLVVEECYKAGAKLVRVKYIDDVINRFAYQYMDINDLKEVPCYQESEYQYMVKHLPSVLHIISDDPSAFKGIDVKKMMDSQNARLKILKPYRDQLESKHKWCIAAVPSAKWAKKVFPKLNENDAVKALWKAILKTSRVDGVNATKNWDEHNAFIKKKCDKLNKLHLQYLLYKANNGTDFKVELNKEGIWCGGSEYTDKNKIFNPNIPSEEVFTSPKAGSCEGKVFASMPLAYQGNLIEDFSIVFENGKVKEVKAKKNQKLLEEMINTDEGSHMLGEVALVPFSSPIRNTKVLFYETLFDENAACHLALGRGFNECLKNGAKLTNEEAHKKGINDSMIHVDFMIGTKDLSIEGISFDGKKYQIFKNGEWAI